MRRGHLFGIRRAVEGLDHLIQERHVNRLREVEDSFHDAATGTVPYLASPPNCLTGCESLIAGGILRLLSRRCALNTVHFPSAIFAKTKSSSKPVPTYVINPGPLFINIYVPCLHLFSKEFVVKREIIQIIYNYILGSVATCWLLTLTVSRCKFSNEMVRRPPRQSPPDSDGMTSSERRRNFPCWSQAFG